MGGRGERPPKSNIRPRETRGFCALTSGGRAVKHGRVLRRLGQLLMVVALLGAMGSHWLVLQSIAWTTMLADNLRVTSLPVALSRTFDGKHPCPLCRQIAAGKRAEGTTSFPLELKRFEFLPNSPRPVLPPAVTCRLLTPSTRSFKSFTSPPPTPPPRITLG